ncbi:MAG: hypothetical protein QOE37_1869 [Microbacteriaceae bacterium]|nr:hypothetical protein [Microbacteriaceae bacterium]
MGSADPMTRTSAVESAAPARRRAALDGIRGLAVLGVFAFHCVLPATGGFLGVDVFFVLSGYLVTGILLREADASGSVRYGRFLVRRLRRLYPALLVASALALVLALTLADDWWRQNTLAQFPLAVLYLADFGPVIGGLLDHTWSLAVEAQFYLVWPFAVLLLARSRFRARLLWGAGVVAAVLPIALGLLVSWRAPYFTPIGHLTPLLLGSAVAVSRPLLPALARVIAPVALVLLLLLLAYPAQLFELLWPETAGMWAASGLTALLLLGLNGTTDRGVTARVLSWRPLSQFGLRSYGFYLFQQPILFSLAPHLPAPWLWIVSFLAALGCCVLSWRFVETRWHRPGSAGFIAMRRRPGVPLPAVEVLS